MKYVFGKALGFAEGVVTTFLVLGSVVGLAYIKTEMVKGNIKDDGNVSETVKSAFESGYNLGDKLS